MSKLRWLPIWLCSFTALNAAANAPLSIEAVYDLHYEGMRIGEVSESFRRDDRQYRIESVARAFPPLDLLVKGPLTLSAEGQVTSEGLRPEKFVQRRGEDASKTYAADFDWQQKVLVLHHHGKVEQHELKARTIDRLSLMYQFVFTPPRANDAAFFMTTGKKVGAYNYRVVGEEKLQTPLGALNTIHVARLAEPGDARIDVWVDKDRHYVPVRVVAEDDGRTLEQIIRALVIN